MDKGMDGEDFMTILQLNIKCLWFGTCWTISQGPSCQFLSILDCFLLFLIRHLLDHQMLQQEHVQANKNSQ